MTLVHEPEAGPAPPGRAAEGVAPSAAPAGAGRRRPAQVIVAAAIAGAALAGGIASLAQSAGPAGPPTVNITAYHSRFEPDRITVKPGETVRFVIHNADPIDHEFIIGPPETHDVHERGEPRIHGAVPGEVTVPAGTTRETTWTFGEAGSPDVVYGCHLAGHYGYGMHGKARIG